MGFGERLRKAIKKIKTKLIVFFVLITIIMMWLVAPAVCSWKQAFEGIPAGQINAMQEVAGVRDVVEPLTEEQAKQVREGKTAGLDQQILIAQFGMYITKPWNAVGLCLSNESYTGVYLKTVLYTYLLFGIAVIVGLVRALPKHEFDDIEHGSSDWSENGEQYQVLNKNKGIVLAEKNYLPVDKRGNVNVLVVGRIWCW